MIAGNPVPVLIPAAPTRLPGVVLDNGPAREPENKKEVKKIHK